MTADALVLPVRARPTLTRVIIAASLGNALEWFDFLVYGFFAVTISFAFFPSGNEISVAAADPRNFQRLVSGLRPVGAILIGTYTDRAGRKAGLTLSILLMVIGTTMTALMLGLCDDRGCGAHLDPCRPPWCRAFRSAASLAAQSPFLPNKPPRAKALSRAGNGPATGITGVLASGFGIVLTSVLSPAQIVEWGWRVPFLFGIFAGPVGLLYSPPPGRDTGICRDHTHPHACTRRAA